MLRWMLLLCVLLLVVNSATGFVQKMGLGRMPGDMRLSIFGKELAVPWVSCLVLAIVLFSLIKLLALAAEWAGLH